MYRHLLSNHKLKSRIAKTVMEAEFEINIAKRNSQRKTLNKLD